MKVGTATEAITVTDQAPLVNTSETRNQQTLQTQRADHAATRGPQHDFPCHSRSGRFRVGNADQQLRLAPAWTTTRRKRPWM